MTRHLLLNGWDTLWRSTLVMTVRVGSVLPKSKGGPSGYPIDAQSGSNGDTIRGSSHTRRRGVILLEAHHSILTRGIRRGDCMGIDPGA